MNTLLKLQIVIGFGMLMTTAFGQWIPETNDSPVTITGNTGFDLWPNQGPEFNITYGDWDYFKQTTNGVTAHQFMGNCAGTATLSWTTYPGFAISYLTTISSTTYDTTMRYKAAAYWGSNKGNINKAVTITWVDSVTGVAHDDDKSVTLNILLK